MSQSIYWYDFETTGIDSIADRPIQFAGQRTNLELEPVGPPQNILCLPGNDVLPEPAALLVTGISLMGLIDHGLNENEFATRVLEQFSKPGTCVAGFNSLRFDDEFTRQMLYRNLRDPYTREWRSGNSRWDIIDLIRMAFALRPDGLAWPAKDDGTPDFRLESMTRANDIAHAGAHDALADVSATIAMARLIREKQPRLYNFLFTLRDKKAVLRQLYPLGKTAVVHVSSMYPASRGCAAIVLPLCQHPTNNNGVLCYDLSADPEALLTATPADIRRLVFSRNDELGSEESRIALKTVHINRCPALAPLTTLGPGRAAALGLDTSLCTANQVRLQRSSGLVEKIQEAFGEQSISAADDPDRLLYGGGFFSDADRQVMNEIHGSSPESLEKYGRRFQDNRLPEMLFRFRARNYPDSLGQREVETWNAYRRSKWTQEGDLARIRDEVASLQATATLDREQAIAADLSDYLDHISAGVFSTAGT